MQFSCRANVAVGQMSCYQNRVIPTRFLQILLPIELIQNSKFKVFLFGSIQEDRHKVEQFYFLLNSSTFYGTVPQFVEQCPKNVEQLPKIGTGPEIRSLFQNLWNSSC